MGSPTGRSSRAVSSFSRIPNPQYLSTSLWKKPSFTVKLVKLVSVCQQGLLFSRIRFLSRSTSLLSKTSTDAELYTRETGIGGVDVIVAVGDGVKVFVLVGVLVG